MDALIQRFENEVIRGYTDLLRAQYRIHPRFDGIRRQWDALLSDPQRLVNGPFLEAAANYEFGESLDKLPLAPATRKTVENVTGRPAALSSSEPCAQTVASAEQTECRCRDRHEQRQNTLFSNSDS